jgi:hypothetical protein
VSGIRWSMVMWRRDLYVLRKEIEELDGRCDSGVLSNVEVDERKSKFEELWKLWKSKESLLIQR